MSESTVPGEAEMLERLEAWMREIAALEQPPTGVVDQAVARAVSTPQLESGGRDAWGGRRPRQVLAGRVLVRAASVLLLAGGVIGLVVIDTAPDDPPPQTVPSTVATVPPPAPTPSTTAVPVAPVVVDRGNLTAAGPYELITLEGLGAGRGVDVYAHSADGTRRLVRHVNQSSLPLGSELNGYGDVSRTGWLALSLGSNWEKGFAFVDMLDPDKPPVVMGRPSLGGAWGPTDLYALMLSNVPAAVVDPATGEITEVPNAMLPGGNPDVIWSADGSALLSGSGGSFTDAVPATAPRTWSLTPIDGSPDVPGVGALDPFNTTRYVTSSGDWLTVGACTSVLDRCTPNSDLFDGTRQNKVVVAHPDGTTSTWYDDDLVGSQLMQSQFSADGQSIWLVLSRTTDNGPTEWVLARVVTPRDVAIVATLPASAADADGYADMWLAPDDSVAWITSDSGQQLIRTDGSSDPITVRGRVAGFVPTAVVEAIRP